MWCLAVSKIQELTTSTFLHGTPFLTLVFELKVEVLSSSLVPRLLHSGMQTWQLRRWEKLFLVISNGAEFPEQTDNILQHFIFGAETPEMAGNASYFTVTFGYRCSKISLGVCCL